MGKLSVAAILGLAFVYSFCVSEINGQEKSCKSAVADLTKRQLQGMAKCTKSLKFKNGKDKAAKSTCILKCVMINEAILTEKGELTQEGIDAFIDKEFAEDLRPNVRKHFQPCLDEFGSLLDITEELCKTYDPLIKCVMAKLPLLCGS